MRIARGRAEDVPTRQPTDTFTGTVFMDPVVPSTDGVMVNSVAFQPGARTNWHTHDGGQVLIVTAGQGIVALETGEREVVRAGDTIWFAPGERHWHGGGPDTHMVHTAVSIGTTNWAEPVTDEQYQGT
jgi:quercetin dioxygenase-like cupin family protein